MSKTTNTANKTDYLGGIEYDANALKRISFSEGYAELLPNATYEYKYAIKDHLGNTRSLFSQDATTLQRNHYYAFGLSIASLDFSGAGAAWKYQYNGKEKQTDFGLNWQDFGERMYDPVVGKWHSVDLLAKERYWATPYNFVQNNPLNRFDPNGLTDYTLNKKTGEVKEVVYDDQEKQKANTEAKTDRIVKTNRKGEIKYNKKGDAKAAVKDVEKGILKDGQNFKTQDNLIAVGGEGQPTEGGVEAFALKLADYVGREIAGAYFGNEKTTHVSIGNYDRNTLYRSVATGQNLGHRRGLNTTGFFHTHPNTAGPGNSRRFEGSPGDLDFRDAALKHMPHLRFFILTQPANYDDTFPDKREFTKQGGR